MAKACDSYGVGYLKSATSLLYPEFSSRDSKLNVKTTADQTEEPENVRGGDCGAPVLSSSSLELQVLLFYNVWLFGVWALLMIAITVWKLSWFGFFPTSNVISLALLVLFLILEPVRLWWGYSGNLQESAPSLVGHLMLTVMTSLPLCIWFVVLQGLLKYGFVMPLELAVNAVYLALTLPQVYYGYKAAKAMVKQQASFLIQELNSASIHPLKENVSDKLGSSETVGMSESKLHQKSWNGSRVLPATEQTRVLSPSSVMSPLQESKKAF